MGVNIPKIDFSQIVADAFNAAEAHGASDSSADDILLQAEAHAAAFVEPVSTVLPHARGLPLASRPSAVASRPPVLADMDVRQPSSSSRPYAPVLPVVIWRRIGTYAGPRDSALLSVTSRGLDLRPHTIFARQKHLPAWISRRWNDTGVSRSLPCNIVLSGPLLQAIHPGTSLHLRVLTRVEPMVPFDDLVTVRSMSATSLVVMTSGGPEQVLVPRAVHPREEAPHSESQYFFFTMLCPRGKQMGKMAKLWVQTNKKALGFCRKPCTIPADIQWVTYP